MSTPEPEPTPGQQRAQELLDEAGPLPDHLITKIAARMKKADPDRAQRDRKPA